MSKSKWYSELDFEDSFDIKDDQKNYWDPEFGSRTLDIAAGKILWEMFMNKNELQYGSNYQNFVNGFLATMNELADANVLVSGHLR